MIYSKNGIQNGLKVQILVNSLKKLKLYPSFKNYTLTLKMLYYLIKKSYFDINNQPVFLTGTNRSGASLLSFILRQNTELHTLNSEILNKPLKKM